MRLWWWMCDIVAMWSQGFISINSSHYGRFHKISRSPISLLHPPPPNLLSLLLVLHPTATLSVSPQTYGSLHNRWGSRPGRRVRLLQCDEFSTLSNYVSNQARLAPPPQTGNQPPRKSQRKYWLRFYVFIYLLIHFALHCRSTAGVCVWFFSFSPLRIDWLTN